ncbi:hypothetical protein [Lonepinella sp. BR2271]|uniref:hypothetical protein n=1 Tax=Lonepinella sp. BR2271 TaxID=3434550 RepID=UPI003F6E41D4
MIDIKGDLLALKQQRERDYISIPDFIEDIKKKGSANFYYEVANWLLAKLYNNNPDNFDLRTSQDCYNWACENEIAVYTLPDSLYKEPEKCLINIFFNALSKLEYNQNELIFSTLYELLGSDYYDYYLKRDQIYSYLNIADEDKDNDSVEKNQIQEKIMTLSWALTKTDEFVKNTDINKSPVGTAERFVFEQTIKNKNERIAELEKQLADLQNSTAPTTETETINQSVVNNNEFFIYGHSSELLEILMKACKEFWQNYQTPPKNSVIESWIEANYPIKEYPYVSKSVRQYIATILRPQPKIR